MIEVRVDDLAFFEGDAIIRPVNAELGATTPLMRRLEAAGGPKLLDQLNLQEPLPIGAAIVTGAGDLGVELLVHAVISNREERVTRQTVRQALASALHRAEAWQLRRVGLAPFGLGAGNLSIEDSAEAMLDVLAAHLRRARFPEVVTIVAETPDEEEAVQAAVRRSGS